MSTKVNKSLALDQVFCYDISAMKKELHPKYAKAVIKCACGNEIVTRSTVTPEMHVELCSACHPFYTGKQKFVDTAGRVDKFRARLEKAQAKEKTGVKEATKEEKSNLEKLAEIKKEITADKTEKGVAVSQENTSDTEAAAAEELKEN